MNPQYLGTGTADGVVTLRIQKNTPTTRRLELLQEAAALAKAHSTKSKVYRTDWRKYHQKKKNNNQISML